MTKNISKFLQEVKDKKIDGVMNLELDLIYYEKWFEKHDEDEWRDKLSAAQTEMEEENLKLSRNNKGKVIADNRDLDKVQEISQRVGEANHMIDKIKNVKNQRLRSLEVYNDLKMYINLINNEVDEAVIKRLEEAANL